MKIAINCKNCENPFGELQKKVISLDYKRVNNIQFDFETKKTSVKCRKCSHYSLLSYDEDLKNEVDYKKTASGLLG